MGWARGSEVAIDLIKSAKKHVPTACRKQFYIDMIKALETCDWDTHDEATGVDPLFDQVYNKRFGDDE